MLALEGMRLIMDNTLRLRKMQSALESWKHYVAEYGWLSRAYTQVFALQCICIWHEEVNRLVQAREFTADVCTEKRLQQVQERSFRFWAMSVATHKGLHRLVKRSQRSNGRLAWISYQKPLRHAINVALRVEIW